MLFNTQRRGVITLVFSKGDRMKLKNWWPITLLTTDCKILTKALANRLKNVLHLLIHPDQTACIPGRTINNNISLIRDAIYFANESNTPLAIISIDQLKAFERVAHNLLFHTLEQFGFCSVFIKWFKTVYNSVSSSVKVNGWLSSTWTEGSAKAVLYPCPFTSLPPTFWPSTYVLIHQSKAYACPKTQPPPSSHNTRTIREMINQFITLSTP